MPNNKKSWIYIPKGDTLGGVAADKLTGAMGSWAFIVAFIILLFVWMGVNLYWLHGKDVFDPYPFILLNLFLSCLAAIQAPIILMSENRELERDRKRSQRDHYINRKAEREIKELKLDILELKEMVSKQSTREEQQELKKEIKAIQEELKKFQN